MMYDNRKEKTTLDNYINTFMFDQIDSQISTKDRKQLSWKLCSYRQL